MAFLRHLTRVEIVSLKGLERFREIRKIEDLMKFKN